MSTSFSQWFWKYGYILLVPVLLLFFWLNGMGERENQANVNPEVFAYFEKVKNDCRAEDFNNQSKACADIFRHKKNCEKISVECNSRTFYELLVSLGYQPPEYFSPGYVPK